MHRRSATKLHTSWLIAWASLGLLSGAVASVVIKTDYFLDFVWLPVACSILLVCFIAQKKWLAAAALVAGCLIGLWRGGNLQAGLEIYKPYYGKIVTLQGRVGQDASYGVRGDQRLTLTNIRIDGEYFPGEVWTSVPKADIQRGDEVIIKGMMKEGFGNMSATIVRAEAKEIVRPFPGDIARRVRDWFGDGARKAIPEPQVNLGLGYLLGQKTALPAELEEQIRIVGLTHVVVASGYNLTILVVFARRICAGLSKFAAALCSALMIISFMMITGLSPSMTRAGLVAGLSLLVWYYGRKTHPFVLLSFAAAATVFVNPSYIWGDLGWYLSFGSFIGVIILAPLIHHYFWGLEGKAHVLRQLTVETMSAQILTMPVILLYFGTYSYYALPANILVLPLVPAAMLFTFIAGIAGLAVPSLAWLVGIPATLLLRYSTGVIDKMANMPDAQKELVFNTSLMIAGYIAIAILMIFLKRRTGHDFRGEDAIEKY